MLDGSLAKHKATSAKNADRIKQNASRAKTIKTNAIANSKKMDAMTRDMKSNRVKIDKNASLITARRDSILKNAADIGKNQAKVAKIISP